MLGRDSYYTVIILQIYKYFIKTIWNIYFFFKTFSIFVANKSKESFTRGIFCKIKY